MDVTIRLTRNPEALASAVRTLVPRRSSASAGDDAAPRELITRDKQQLVVDNYARWPMMQALPAAAFPENSTPG